MLGDDDTTADASACSGDEDSAAIRARRGRFVLSALSGLSVVLCNATCQPCLSLAAGGEGPGGENAGGGGEGGDGGAGAGALGGGGSGGAGGGGGQAEGGAGGDGGADGDGGAGGQSD